MIKQLKYTISEVSKILVPLEQTFASGNRSGLAELESCELPQWYTLTGYCHHIAKYAGCEIQQ